MRHKNNSIEDICIRKIKLGIESMKDGTRKAEDIALDLESLFTRLEATNKYMFEELWTKYCLVRLKSGGVVSTIG